MSDGEFCLHCEMQKAYCPHGNPEAAAALRGDLIADGPTIEASQESPCAGCGKKIEVGDSITHTDEGWAHTAEAVRLPTTAPRTDPDLFGGI